MPESVFSEALRTPFALASLSLVGVCIVLYALSYVVPNKRAVRSRPLALVALAFFSSVSAMVTFQAARAIENDREFRSAHESFAVHASVSGTVRTTAVSEPRTFSVSSGQFNVGCNDTRQAVVTWTPPIGAIDIQSAAEWVNANNTKGLSQSVTVGPTITATGQISGLDRGFFGDCPGGGHGELLLRGTFRISESRPSSNQTLKTIDDKVSRGQRLVIAIPNDDGVTPETLDVVVSDDSGRQVEVRYQLRREASGVTYLTDRRLLKQERDLTVDVSIEGERIIVRVP